MNIIAMSESVLEKYTSRGESTLYECEIDLATYLEQRSGRLVIDPA